MRDDIVWDLEPYLDLDYLKFIKQQKEIPNLKLEYYMNFIQLYRDESRFHWQDESLDESKINSAYIIYLYKKALISPTAPRARALSLDGTSILCTTSSFIYNELGIREIEINFSESKKDKLYGFRKDEIIVYGTTDMFFRFYGIKEIQNHPITFVIDELGILKEYKDIPLNLLNLFASNFEYTPDAIFDFLSYSNISKDIGIADMDAFLGRNTNLENLDNFIKILNMYPKSLNMDSITIKLNYRSLTLKPTRYSKYDSKQILELNLAEYLNMILKWNTILLEHFKCVEFLIITPVLESEIKNYCIDNGIFASVISTNNSSFGLA